MTRKDYKLIADVIIKLFDDEDIDGTQNLIDSLSQCFKADNPRFDEDKFNDYIWSKTTRED